MKLKGLKVCFRKWNKETYDILDLEVVEAVKAVNELDQLIEGVNGSVSDQIRRD